MMGALELSAQLKHRSRKGQGRRPVDSRSGRYPEGSLGARGSGGGGGMNAVDGPDNRSVKYTSASSGLLN